MVSKISRVAVYDSGVGGLSIYQQIVANCPGAECVFISDNQAYPYGTKADADLLQRVLSVSERIVRNHPPDVLVLACNTASTVCLPHLRERYTLPVVGVVPAIKPAAMISNSRVIGLLATPATINRPYTDALINDFAEDHTVYKVGSSELVELAEMKLRGEALDLTIIDAILSPFLECPELDTLVLACTHFPLLRQEIQTAFDQHGHAIRLVDSGAAIAKRVRSLLPSLLPSLTDGARDNLNLCSGHVAVFTQPVASKSFTHNLKSMGFSAIETLKT